MHIEGANWHTFTSYWVQMTSEIASITWPVTSRLRQNQVLKLVKKTPSFYLSCYQERLFDQHQEARKRLKCLQ